MRLEKSSLLISLIYYYGYLFWAKLLTRGSKRIVVLIYHSIGEGMLQEEDRLGLNLSTHVFEWQMQYLIKQKRSKIISIQEAEIILAGRYSEPGIDTYYLFSFDDGLKNFKSKVVPLLEQYHVPVLLFQIAHPLLKTEETYLRSRYGSDYTTKWRLMDREEIQAVSHSPWVSIGSHSLTHSDCWTDHLEEELQGSKRLLEEATGKIVNYFSCPYGMVREKVLLAAKKFGYKRVFTSICNWNSFRGSTNNRYTVNRIEISSFDGALKFKLKINGAYNWKRFLKSHQILP
ncbi:MAG: polysaccharide deacetylase family protein [Oligoflexia bacterium]|nr:polysaccharide deacetylase family protein [Oligoflexia bacterium]